MNGQGFHPNAPALARQTPRAYYAWLVSQGMPHSMAYSQTTGVFGAPKSPDQINRENANAAQRGQFGQAAGVVGGALLTNEALRNFPNVREAIGATQTPVMAESGTIGLTRSVPPPTTTVDGSGAVVDVGGGGGLATPKVLEVKGATATIQTPAGVEQVPTEALNDPGFFSSIDWGKAAQGGMGALQLYQAYKSLQGGDKVGAGLYGATGAANIAASGLAGTAASQLAGDALGGYLVPGLNVATSLYGGYKTAEAIGDMAAGKQRYRTGALGMAGAGAAIGSVIPGVGTAVGAAVGALAGLTAAKFGSSKGKGQVQRDAIRSALQEQGILDENFQGTLADGSVTDFGQDGSKLNTKAMNKLRSENPNAFEQAQQLGDAMAASYGFMGDKARSLARLYVRGALSNAQDDPNTAIANMQHFAKQQGITPDILQTNLSQALEQNRISQGEYDRLLSAGQQLIGVSPQMQQAAPIPRPEKGQVARQSAGLYRDDKGNLVRAKSMRQALNKAYNKSKEKEKK